MKRFLMPVVLSLLVSLSPAQTPTNDGKVFWRGSVDDKVQLSIVGIELTETTMSGKPQAKGEHSFTARMPAAAVTVIATKVEGRGKVSVIQQPTAENGFTAIIEIHDDRGGTSEYLLDINWR